MFSPAADGGSYNEMEAYLYFCRCVHAGPFFLRGWLRFAGYRTPCVYAIRFIRA